MPRAGYVFTPQAIETIRGLADLGKSAAEIAHVIGSTPASVRVKCCHLKIKLSRRGRPSLPRTKPHHIAEQNLIIVSIRPAVYAALNRKAAHMKKSAVEFAGTLLEAIVTGDLYDTVLRDGE
jgi:hypothetical protein